MISGPDINPKIKIPKTAGTKFYLQWYHLYIIYKSKLWDRNEGVAQEKKGVPAPMIIIEKNREKKNALGKRIMTTCRTNKYLVLLITA